VTRKFGQAAQPGRLHKHPTTTNQIASYSTINQLTGTYRARWLHSIATLSKNELLFVFWQHVSRWKLGIGKRQENLDFQYLFMVSDFFGCDPEAILSPHIRRPRSTLMESCSIMLRKSVGKFCSLSRRKTSYAEWQWHISGQWSRLFCLVSPCSAHHLLTFLSEKPRRGAPNWSNKAVEISPHVIPLVRFSLITISKRHCFCINVSSKLYLGDRWGKISSLAFYGQLPKTDRTKKVTDRVYWKSKFSRLFPIPSFHLETCCRKKKK